MQTFKIRLNLGHVLQRPRLSLLLLYFFCGVIDVVNGGELGDDLNMFIVGKVMKELLAGRIEACD